jgi:hypothetical protein
VDGNEDSLARQIAAAGEAAANVFGEWAQRIAEATTEAIEKLGSDPAIRSALRASRPTFVWARRDCECPCAVAHPHDVGVCDHNAVMTRPVTSDLSGPVDVQLCAPCATAQGVEEFSR